MVSIVCVYFHRIFPDMFDSLSYTVHYAQATPHLSTKRKSLHGRKLRPKSVVDSVEGLSADDIPDLLPSLPKSAEGRYVTACKLAPSNAVQAKTFPTSVQRFLGLQSWLWHWLSTLRCSLFGSVPPQEKHLQLGHEHFSLHLLQFSIHHSPVNVAAESDLLTASASKLQVSPSEPIEGCVS
jgi:hypothetical protein